MAQQFPRRQEAFYDAVVSDPTMDADRKLEWLLVTCRDYDARLTRLTGLLESYLADHTWRARESGAGHGCGCPACLGARDALGRAG